jgi:uncharacterized membrane protein
MGNFTAELYTFFAAMLPFVELKAAIPLGMKMGLSSITSYFFAVAGTIIPAVIYLAILGPLSKFAMKKSKFVNKFLTNIFNTARNKHEKKIQKYGPIFLAIFVGIPIPGSGTTAGAIIAFVFGMEYWKSLAYISIGAMISGALVLGGTTSIFALMNLFH